jgi:guanyl-specific ribonuclease Sa
MRRGLRQAVELAMSVRQDMIALTQLVASGASAASVSSSTSTPARARAAEEEAAMSAAMQMLATTELPHVDRFLFEHALDLVSLGLLLSLCS